ncbi:MAG: hypothetical protein VYA34_12055 [Myxococcota bacterium]|nr:hypothetical protein [Myxococcota bacterium]
MLAALGVSRVIVVDNGITELTAEVTKTAGAMVVAEKQGGLWSCASGGH